MKNLYTIFLFLVLFACDKQKFESKPILTTTPITGITSNAVITGGSISSDGNDPILNRGMVWSTVNNPTIILNTKTSDGKGLGLFQSNITGLEANTTYFVRAFATNNFGTSYGNELTFKTLMASSFFTVIGANGKIWMDRNLGASQVAVNNTDTNAFGGLYQWGRGSDGHQLRKSTTASGLSASDVPGNTNFIIPPGPPNDWRSPQNIFLWQGANGTNNPCPAGYRLPTEAEWIAEVASWNVTNAAGAFASTLKLPMGGNRDGLVGSIGSSGNYWSSTISGAGSRYLYFGSSTSLTLTHDRSFGGSVRCIKD